MNVQEKKKWREEWKEREDMEKKKRNGKNELL